MQRQVHDPRRNIGMFETYLQELRLKDERHPDKGRSEKIDSGRFYETGSLAFYPECSKTELNLENQPFLIPKKERLMIVDCSMPLPFCLVHRRTDIQRQAKLITFSG
jgi:hypothetical protein